MGKELSIQEADWAYGQAEKKAPPRLKWGENFSFDVREGHQSGNAKHEWAWFFSI